MDVRSLCLLGLLVACCLAGWHCVSAVPQSGALSASRQDWTPLVEYRPRVDRTVSRMRAESRVDEESDEEEDYDDEAEELDVTHSPQKIEDEYDKEEKMKKRKGGHVKLKLKGLKKLKKYLVPILIAYKLKFLLIIPVLLAGMFMLMGTTAFAGFFFALFAIGLGLKKDH